MESKKKYENLFSKAAWFFELGKIVLIFTIFFIILNFFVLTIFIVNGESMEPNFHTNEVILVNRISYLFVNPKRGDVVIFHYPGAPSEKYIKRIIGLPGEKVSIKNNKVYIYNKENPQGFLLNEYYIPYNLDLGSDLNEDLSINEYFVIGDNRENSSDSRTWGVLPKEFIIGRGFFILFPPTRWQFINTINYGL